MESEKIILAIESSVRTGSVSLLRGQKELGSWVCEESESMSQNLILGIKKLLEQHNIQKNELDLVAVSNGPGSLTGIRVGISVAKGLSFAIGITCVGISLLEAMFTSVQVAVDTTIFTIISGGRNQFYWQRFEIENAFNSIEFGNLTDLSNQLNLFPQASVLVDNYSSELFSKLEFDCEQMIVCNKNLSYLIGNKAFQIYQDKNSSRPIPIYVQENNFKKSS